MDNLVRAAAVLKRDLPSAKVLIAGEGPTARCWRG